MPEPFTMLAIGIGFLIKKKIIFAVGHSLAMSAVVHGAAVNATAIAHFTAAHAAAIVSVTGGVVLSAVLAEIADILATVVTAGQMDKQEAKQLLKKAKTLYEKRQQQMKNELVEWCEKWKAA
jgi:hypothetical protein